MSDVRYSLAVEMTFYSIHSSLPLPFIAILVREARAKIDIL